MPTTLRPDLDPQDMHGAIRAFPDHLEEGWRRGAVAEGSRLDARSDVRAREGGVGAVRSAEGFGLDARRFNGVVVCGMGGSAIGGDLVRTLAEPEAPVPMTVVRGYDLPVWVAERTLVVVSSYSGGTEETLSCFEQARQRGATLVVIASGGEVMEHAGRDGLFSIEIPGGLQPRAALGYSLGALLRFARAIGLLKLSDEAFTEALEAARVRAADFSRGDRSNHAFEIAKSFDGHLPVIYSGVGLLEAVNMRWRTQLHENAKHPAVGNLFPELDHNEIMGFESAPREIAGKMSVVVLRDRDDHAQIRRRFEVTRDLVARRVAAWREVETEGDGRLARMLSLVQLGDWASFWLAVRKGVDPTPVESIQQLKRQLAG